MTSTHPYRRYGGLQLAMAVLLAVVVCWLGERTSLPDTAVRGGPAFERVQPDTQPGKLAESTFEGQAAEAESSDGSEDVDPLVVHAAAERVNGLAFRLFDGGRELNDGRVRSTVSARGPPVV